MNLYPIVLSRWWPECHQWHSWLPAQEEGEHHCSMFILLEAQRRGGLPAPPVAWMGLHGGICFYMRLFKGQDSQGKQQAGCPEIPVLPEPQALIKNGENL